MSNYRNNVANAVSGTPGTGTITLGSAVTGAQSFAAAYGANATVDVFITDGNAWEVARGCTYTHSGTTLTRGTLEASSTGAVLSLTSAAVVRVAMPASVAQNLAFASVVGPDAATTMEVGRRYLIDLSTFTANRTYTLPATCAVGDRVQVVVTEGSATRAVLFAAASGDTLNGVAGGTEWSRLFTVGETLTFVCTGADSAWIVEVDGRIPCRAYSNDTVSAPASFTNYAPSFATKNDPQSIIVGSTFTSRRANWYTFTQIAKVMASNSSVRINSPIFGGGAEGSLEQHITSQSHTNFYAVGATQTFFAQRGNNGSQIQFATSVLEVLR